MGPIQQQALWNQFPLARAAWDNRQEVLLDEGDVLFIPALWLHCTEAIGGCAGVDHPICISVNVFLMKPELVTLHDPKDVWANRELLPAQAELRTLEERVWPALRSLPSNHQAFCCRKLAASFLQRAEELEAA